MDCLLILKLDDCGVPVIFIVKCLFAKCDILSVLLLLCLCTCVVQKGLIYLIFMYDNKLISPTYQADALPTGDCNNKRCVLTELWKNYQSSHIWHLKLCFLSIAKGSGFQKQLAQNVLLSIVMVGEYWNKNFICSQ